MGVSWVFECDHSSAASVQRALLLAGGQAIGTYTVDCTRFKPCDQGISHMYLLHHSEFPFTAFSIAPGENFKSSPRASCDRGFDFILPKLSSGLQADYAGKFEVAGTELALRDFRVRVGAATQGTQAKGVIVEVEYAPSIVASQAMPILIEFIQAFFPEQSACRPEVLCKTSPERYDALETIYQYAVLFAAMRKKPTI